MSDGIRFGTDIITFYDSAWWGLEADLSHRDWVAAYAKDPRHYLERMLDGVAEAGLEGVELAPEPATWESALDVYGDARGIRDACASRGLEISSAYAPGRQLIGDAIADPSLEAAADRSIDRQAALLAELGATTIVIGNLARSRFGNDSPDDTATPEDFSAPVAREVHERFADHMNRLGAIAGRHGVRLGIHTDAYSVCSRPQDVDTVMALTDPDTVGLCIDAGHIALDGEDPVEVLRRHVDRTWTMHWKDCAAPLGGHTLRGVQKERHATMLRSFRILGDGVVDWHAWMDVLRTAGWSGWAIEEIDMSPDPVGELRRGLDFYRRELAGR